jgi:hypothetical protein
MAACATALRDFAHAIGRGTARLHTYLLDSGLAPARARNDGDYFFACGKYFCRYFGSGADCPFWIGIR